MHRLPKLTWTFDPVTQNELDNAKSGIPSQGGKDDLDLWPCDQNQFGFSPHHQQPTCEVWKWFDINCSLYCAHKAWYRECQSWPWYLTPWPKINRVLPLIIHNLHAKFERDLAKTVVAIVCTRSYTQSAKVDLDLWPLWSKVNRVPPLIIHNLHVKFESDYTKPVVAIMSTRSYTQSAKVDLDLWPPWQKINGVPSLIIHNLHENFESDWT